MNTFTGVWECSQLKASDNPWRSEGKNQKGNWVLRLGLSHPVRLARRSGNWFRNHCQPREILEVCCHLIPSTDHYVVLRDPLGWGFLFHTKETLMKANI